MLTEAEIKSMKFVYSALCCKVVVSLFSWDKLKLSVRPNCMPITYWIINSILLSEFYFGLKQLSILIQNRQMNAVILQVIFLERFICHFMLRVNMSKYKTEFVRLINQATDIDNKWGKQKLDSIFNSYT